MIGGPSICPGYLVDPKNPDPDVVKKNKEDFVTVDNVRYFCTGDIGEVDDLGRVKIIDRKKDLFKGSSGEYVALSKVEAALKLSSLVEMPMVYGRTGESCVVALICPQKPAIEELKASLKIDEAYGPDLCQRPEIIRAVSEALVLQCKKAGLLSFETPRGYRLCVSTDGSPAWTPDNGYLTSTMKLKRPVIAKAYQDDIAAAYAAASASK